MTRVTWAVLSAAAVIGFSGAARAEEKPATPCSDAHADAPASIESEAFAFERDMDRYTRHRAFTERLVAEREARAFEEEQARYERFRELTKKLAREAERAVEQDFERAIELHLAKARLTKALAAGDSSAPSW